MAEPTDNVDTETFQNLHRLRGLRNENRDPADVTDRYREALSTLGAAVRVELPSGAVEGRAVAVEADGRLVVLDACAVTHRIDVGDVVHLRPASG